MSGRSSSAQRAHSATVRSATRDSIDASAARAQASASIQTSLARPTSSGWGKCTETLKCMVPDDEKVAFVLKARQMGYQSESDCLRELVMVFLHGHERMAKVHADRLRALAGFVQESDL